MPLNMQKRGLIIYIRNKWGDVFISMEYIRAYYKVPAKKGQKVLALGNLGVITGARGAHLRIRLEGRKDHFYTTPLGKYSICNS